MMNSCITLSYLGQWCTVLLMFRYDEVLSNVKTHSSCRKKLTEEFKEWDDTQGIDGAIEKQASRCALG